MVGSSAGKTLRGIGTQTSSQCSSQYPHPPVPPSLAKSPALVSCLANRIDVWSIYVGCCSSVNTYQDGPCRHPQTTQAGSGGSGPRIVGKRGSGLKIDRTALYPIDRAAVLQAFSPGIFR